MTFIKIHGTFCLLLVNHRTHLLRKTFYIIFVLPFLMVFLNNVTILRENGRKFAAMCTNKIKQNPLTFYLHDGIFSVSILA